MPFKTHLIFYFQLNKKQDILQNANDAPQSPVAMKLQKVP